MTVSQIARQATVFVTTLVLVRLLAPADFGLLSMALIATGFLAMFRDLGLSSAVVQAKSVSEPLLSVVFWANAVLGTASALLLLGAAPLVALFFSEPRVTPVLSWLAITFVLAGLGSLQQSLLERELAFARLAVLEVASTLLGAIAGIASALHGHGVYALVVQSVVATAASTAGLWIAASWRPRLVFDVGILRSVASFSLNLTGFSVFNYFIRNADNLLVGRVLGSTELGYYTLAYRILLYPVQNIAGVLGRVMLPVFARFQDDDARFRKAYLRVTSSIALVTFPLMFGLCAVAAPFVAGILGAKWGPVAALIVVLCPVGAVQSIGTTVGAIYTAKGRTDWMFRWGVGAGLLITGSFVVGLPYGIQGVAWAYAVITLILAYPGFAIPFRLVDLPFADLVRSVWPPFWTSLAMVAFVLLLRSALESLPPRTLLAIAVPAGGACYLGLSWYFNRLALLDVYGLATGRGRS